MLGLGNRGRGYKDNMGGAGRESREERRSDSKHRGVAEQDKLGAGRQRGVFAFTLAGEEALSHPPFYTATPDPWTMRLERAPPIPEPAK